MTDEELMRQGAEAQYAAAERYRLGGDGVEPDDALAVKWYVKSAERGYAPAQYMMGRIYEKGVGVTVSPRLAALWYTKAAEQEHAEAQYRLAQCYERGAGVDRDPDTAKYWYSKAAENGYE